MNIFLSPLLRRNSAIKPHDILFASYRSKTRGVKPPEPLYSNARRKRMPMTTKIANKNYYKGNGCRREGLKTSKGRFIRIPEMCTELVVPDLTDFKLKPYVARNIVKNLREPIVDLESLNA